MIISSSYTSEKNFSVKCSLIPGKWECSKQSFFESVGTKATL